MADFFPRVVLVLGLIKRQLSLPQLKKNTDTTNLELPHRRLSRSLVIRTLEVLVQLYSISILVPGLKLYIPEP